MRASLKIKTIEELIDALEAERARGKKVVHCHGVFDLMHLGHIRHFQEAKTFGDVLVVTLTPDRHVNKGPHRPAFSEKLRAEAIAALECVDYVAINRWAMAVETIQLLRPHFFVKGSEYKAAEKDRTKGIQLESRAIESVGGKLVFTEDIVCSSSKLINRHLPVFSRETNEYLDRFRSRFSAEEIVEGIEGLRPLRVLAVGEAIIDEYVYCSAIGKSSKEPTLAVKRLAGERFAGGILAVANHLAAVCDHASILSFLGGKKPQEAFIARRLKQNVDPVLLRRKDAPTVVKRRFIERYFFSKLLEVYDVNDDPLASEENGELCSKLRELVPAYDLVIVKDFGHGMLTPEAIDILCHHSRFLGLHVQTNAANLGYHSVTKYSKADFVVFAENELKLEARTRQGDLKEMASAMTRRLSARCVAVTRGKYGCLCFDRDQGFVEVPALATKVVDRVGGGGAFLAIAGLCAVRGLPVEVLGFLGNAAAAQAVATVGHRRPLERLKLIRQVESLLK